MKHVIIGTAGHVDHGKTTLIKALTGIDTDRLGEEKKRGITIELGFAHLDFADGLQAGIVDVPGHERFIRHMLAGAGGIDLAMLVVAADEGFMPQTVEHLDILKLLGIKDGLVVITKADAAEEEWISMVEEDIKERVKGSFLEAKPVLRVSALSGLGIEALKGALHDLVLAAAEKNVRTPFRLPIDRVFSVEGFGTVVTGTLTEGSVGVGSSACILPDGLDCRIRNVQVHGRDVENAFAGQRAAINLAGIKKSEIARGDCLAAPSSTPVSMMLDVHISNLPASGRSMRNNSRLHLYHGSSERLAKLVLFDRDSLEPGQDCYAQLRLEEDIATRRGDRFVLRFFSPLETIGGGVIVDPKPQRHRRNEPGLIERLALKEHGSEDRRLAQSLEEFGTAPVSAEQFAKKENTDVETVKEALGALIAEGRAVEIVPGGYVAAAVLDSLYTSCRKILEAYHRDNPLQFGIKLAELRQKLLSGVEVSVANAIIRRFVEEGKLKTAAERYSLFDFSVKLSKKQKNIKDKLIEIYRKAGAEAPSVDELAKEFPPGDKAELKAVADNMLSEGLIVMLTPGVAMDKTAFERVCAMTAEHFTENAELTLAEFRDKLSTSRKYALYILEYFDTLKILKKEGDVRRLDRGF